jgi:nucleoside-triphosphatase THEP1
MSRQIILTGPIRTGKTTALARAFPPGATRARGILQPVVEGRRCVCDLAAGEMRPLEAAPGAPGSVVVGRFCFDAEVLAWAGETVREAAEAAAPGEWLVIDEVGPLELRGEGLDAAVRDAVLASAARGFALLLVVREGLVERARERYGLASAQVIGVEALGQLPGYSSEVSS